jgi:hypothetical protein
MAKRQWHRSALALSAGILLLCSGAAISPEMEIKILRKALGNALGDKAKAGKRRLVTLRQDVMEGRNTLVIGVIAKDSPTPAGLRHGAFTDVVKILGVLKSWGWPSRIDRAMIGEYYGRAKGSDSTAVPLLKLVVSAETIRRIDWKTFEPAKIPEIVDAVEMDAIIR